MAHLKLRWLQRSRPGHWHLVKLFAGQGSPSPVDHAQRTGPCLHHEASKWWRKSLAWPPRNKCRLLLMWWDLRHEQLVCQVTNLIQPFSQKGNCCYMAWGYITLLQLIVFIVAADWTLKAKPKFHPTTACNHALSGKFRVWIRTQFHTKRLLILLVSHTTPKKGHVLNKFRWHPRLRQRYVGDKFHNFPFPPKEPDRNLLLASCQGLPKPPC